MITYTKTKLAGVSQTYNKGKRKVQIVPQSQAAAILWHHEEEDTDKTKQEQIEQTYKKALRLALSLPSEVTTMLKGLKSTTK